MKKTLLFTFLFGTAALHAQNANLAGHTDPLITTSNLVNINGGSFYAEGGCCQTNALLTRVSASGQTVFSATLSLPFLSNYPIKLLRTSDHCLLLLVKSYNSCDTGPNPNHIVKVDTNGTILFVKAVQTGNTAQSPYASVLDITQHPDSSYYLAGSGGLIHYSKTGQFVSNIAAGVSGISAVQALANGHLLVHSAGQNSEVSTTFSTVAAVNETEVITKFAESASGSRYGLSSTGLVKKYTAGLNATGSSAAQVNLGLAATDFMERNDSLFVTGTNTVMGTPFYQVMDQGFNVLYQHLSAYKNVVPKGITMNHNRINVITSGKSILNNSAVFKSLYQFPITGAFVSASDIGVTHVTVTSATFSPSPYVYNNMVPVFSEFELSVTVKNYGSAPVTSFYLNDNTHHNGSLLSCDFFHKLYTTTIAPHDSVVVQTGHIYGPEFGVPVPTQAGDVHHVHACLFTTVPNESNDVNIDNDALCDSLPVTGLMVTGIKENSLHAVHVSVSPNPFASQLHVGADMEISRATLYNLLGEMQQQFTVNKKEASLVPSDLPAGVYIMKLETEKGIVVKKVVKE